MLVHDFPAALSPSKNQSELASRDYSLITKCHFNIGMDSSDCDVTINGDFGVGILELLDAAGSAEEFTFILLVLARAGSDAPVLEVRELGAVSMMGDEPVDVAFANSRLNVGENRFYLGDFGGIL